MSTSSRRRQVVVIDRYPGAQQAIEHMFDSSWDVVTVDSPRLVLHMIGQRIAFDALVADADMEPISGLELCAAAARLERPPRMVLVTTIRTAEHEAFSRRHRVPVLEKPFAAAELRTLLG